MSRMLKNSGKVNINDNIVMGLVMPLIIYYVIHNAWVIGGLSALELAVNSGKMPPWNEEVLFYIKTFVKISGMMIGGLSVYPYFKRQRRYARTARSTPGIGSLPPCPASPSG